MKKLIKLLFSRVFMASILILLQAAILIIAIWRLSDKFTYFYAAFIFLSLFVIFVIINRRINSAYKLVWSITILVLPVFGGLFYLLFGGNRMGRKMRKKMQAIYNNTKPYLKSDPALLDELYLIDKQGAKQASYLINCAHYPLCKNTETKYLPMGEDKFIALIQELEQAKHFVFLEYFIIEPGIMWDRILEILKTKVTQGVEVRLIYDDAGCLQTLPRKYYRTLEKYGIKAVAFNPFRPSLTVRHNSRDHRKIAVIDGWVGFTGGINLADEYINKKVKYGHWKDSSIMLKGQGVWNLTMIFLQTWYIYRPKDAKEDKGRFRPHHYAPEQVYEDGYVLPFGDSPLDDEIVAEYAYLNLINKATQYVYITTPYLVIDDELLTALCVAAKGGTDVRIITPHIPDKWYVHTLTRASYYHLIDAGVKIYEYTPGFIHSKTFVVDDKLGIVGTINLDYRSLYLHFECGVWMYKTKALAEMKEDYLETLKACRQISVQESQNISWRRRWLNAILRLFAPLM
ncbi:MAG: cardiolipin synthase [Clostridia bacterium]|nr:cardiolipin synthase [Clostridia bacterium]MDD4571796.1 cardiolipin synthase [Clostridia bacterium]